MSVIAGSPSESVPDPTSPSGASTTDVVRDGQTPGPFEAPNGSPGGLGNGVAAQAALVTDTVAGSPAGSPVPSTAGPIAAPTEARPAFLPRLREFLVAPPDFSDTVANRVLVGVSLALVALALKALVDRIAGEDSSYLIYFLGVVVSASLAGFWAGLITTGITAIGEIALFFGANGAVGVTAGGEIRLALFLLDGAFVGAVSSALLRQRRHAEQFGQERTRLYDAERAAREAAERSETRAAQLQAVTAALAEAGSPAEVADIIVTRGVAGLGAEAGGLIRLDPDGASVHTLKSAGYDDALTDRYETFPLSLDLPGTKAIRTGELVVCATPTEIAARYPALLTIGDSPSTGAIAAIPFSTEGAVRGAITMSFAQPQSFTAEDRAFMLALGRECGQALEREELHEAERRARRDAEDSRAALEFIANASRVLSSSLDYEATLQRVADLSVPFLAEWCAVDILQPDGSIKALAVAHEDPAGRALLREYRDRFPPAALQRGSAAVISSGETVASASVTAEDVSRMAVSPEIADYANRLKIRSYLSVPLRSGDDVIGAITFSSSRPGHFGSSRVAIAEELALRAGDAIRHARLYREARQLVATVDATLDAVFMFDPVDLRFTYVNQGAVNQVGYTRDELLDMKALEIKPDFDEARYRELIAPLLQGARPSVTFTTTHLHRDGTRVPVETFLQAVHLPAGQVRMIITSRDIRQQIEVEANLYRLARAERARAAELSAVIRGMGEGVLVCDPTGRVILSNPAALSILGAAADSYDDLVELVEADGAELPPLASAGGPTEVRIAGTDRWLDISTYPVSLESELGSDAETTIIVLRDITDARRARAAREAFIGVMSHELRTPITTIYGTTKLFKRAGDSPELMRSMLADVESEADRLYRLVEDLLILSRSETGIQIEGEPVLLQHIIRSVLAAEATRWPETEFTTNVPAGLPPVSGDKTYLEQVVRNLLSNAAKYSPPNTAVNVSAAIAGAEIVVRVSDSGPGFASDEAEQLFGLFYRSPATAKKVSGAGIGLYVSRALIEAMGGRIWARSSANGGAEFGFTVPILEAEADDLEG